jgi:hypothetical protein
MIHVKHRRCRVASSLDPLGIRARLGRDAWGPPTEHGPDGWHYRAAKGQEPGSVIVTCSDLHDDTRQWVHASISRRDRMPTYDEVQLLHRAVWPNGYAYQVFAPPAEHINIHAHALHLWGLPDGVRLLPDFGWAGTI